MQRLLKPEYWFRPSQLLRRLARPRPRPRDAGRRLLVTLPWGLPLEISTGDEIGLAIWQLGVYDLALCETAWRLLDPGETALDVGANVGYVTSLLAARAGPHGRVLAFEPHPRIQAELSAQVARWPSAVAAPVTLHATALSDHAGTAWLREPAEFEHNRGTSTLEAPEVPDRPGHEVATSTLDGLPAVRGGPVGLMKVDVEGHELAVFRGGLDLLREGAVRDVLFEEHHGFPSPACSLLAELGYSLHRVEKSLWRPLLVPPARRPADDWVPPSFLATRDPDRARARLAPAGWRILHPR